MLNLDINIITPSEKFIEAFRLITKVFLGADSNKSLKYTFEKNSWNPFGYSESFPLCLLNDFQQPRVE